MVWNAVKTRKKANPTRKTFTFFVVFCRILIRFVDEEAVLK